MRVWQRIKAFGPWSRPRLERDLEREIPESSRAGSGGVWRPQAFRQRCPYQGGCPPSLGLDAIGAVRARCRLRHADDIRVVLDELGRAPSTLPFSGRLDLSHVGAFGHSFGGIAAAPACHKDQRIKACLNQDGAVAMQPYFPDVWGWGMDQPFTLIERAQRMEPPSDQELAQMKLTRERVNEIRKRLDANRDCVLRATGRGAYRVVLQRTVTTHMDFTDLQMLGATTRSMTA